MEAINGASDAAADRAVLAAWNIGAIRSTATPSSGTINRTVLVDSERGAFALRAYRHRERLRVEHEHAIIKHARARGIPALPPLPLPDGANMLEHNGRFFALFPAAPGMQVPRAALDEARAAAMGSFLARLHQALRDFPPSRALQRSFSFDGASALERIERLLAGIHALGTREPVDDAAITGLQSRRRWLLETAPAAAPDLGALEQQVIHGDYQETNIFWQGSTISAIIDWDQAYSAPRAWELARTLHLVFAFEPAAGRSFLDGYRAVLPLAPDELGRAATAYCLMRAYDLWVYEAYYHQGNRRVARYITAEPFVPLTQAWAGLRAALH